MYALCSPKIDVNNLIISDKSSQLFFPWCTSVSTQQFTTSEMVVFIAKLHCHFTMPHNSSYTHNPTLCTTVFAMKKKFLAEEFFSTFSLKLSTQQHCFLMEQVTKTNVGSKLSQHCILLHSPCLFNSRKARIISLDLKTKPFFQKFHKQITS